jgi:predicted secreted protein
MSLPLAIGLYFVIWWTVLFAILPIGVRTQAEANDVVPGSAPSAPMKPLLLKKALWTSIAAAIVLALVWAAMTYLPFPRVFV